MYNLFYFLKYLITFNIRYFKTSLKFYFYRRLLHLLKHLQYFLLYSSLTFRYLLQQGINIRQYKIHQTINFVGDLFSDVFCLDPESVIMFGLIWIECWSLWGLFWRWPTMQHWVFSPHSLTTILTWAQVARAASL